MIERQRPTLIHLHVPKAAGSSLNRILEEQVPAARSYATSRSAHHPDGSLDGFWALGAEELANLDLLYGHMPFGLHRALPRPAEYVVMLREPVSRLISNYFFEGREPSSYLYDQVRSGEMDFDAYLNFLHAHGIDNIQTRMLAGIYDPNGGPPLTSEILAQAKKNLAEYCTVGLRERFEESYLLLRRRYGWSYTDYGYHNAAPRQSQGEAVPPALRERMAREHQYDVALYAFACERFERQVAAEGRALPLERLRFRFWRLRRRLGQRLGHFYRQARLFSVRYFLRRLAQRVGITGQGPGQQPGQQPDDGRPRGPR